jgi:predicted transposase YbfD/YdcC
MDGESGALVRHFSDLTDPRIDRRRLHELFDIIVIMICAVIGGCDNFEEVELFGTSHADWFKKFLRLPNGIPSHDTFDRVFRRIDPKEFYASFSSWTAELAGRIEGVIAIDGQTHRGAKDTGHRKSPLHVVSAWASEARLVLAQIKVDEKSNEITAIPEILKMLDIQGCIVTIDAMGCQQEIAQQIVDKGGDYALGLKGNQGTSLEAGVDHFNLTSPAACQEFTEVDKGHGRIETRQHLAADASTVVDLKDWPGLASVVKVISTREIGDKVTTEDRYYISSKPASEVKQIANAIRSHWGVENSVHYVLDVTFGQDASRVRKGNAAENFGIVRKLALNLLRAAPVARRGNKSLNLKRKRAAMDLSYLETVIGVKHAEIT